MGKKLNTNSKAEEARNAKANKKDQEKAAMEKAAEDAKWADEGNDRASQRKKAQEAKRQSDLEKKKAQRQKMADEDEASAQISKGKSKAGNAASNKMTRAQINEAAERRKKLELQERAEREAASSKLKGQMRLEENLNRPKEGAAEWTTGIDNAIADLNIKDDRNPEKRKKAAYKAFTEANMPIVKEENPGLKLSQYKEILWKMWAKSPENPANQA